MRDHQLDNRLNLIALLAALGMLAFGVVEGARHAAPTATTIAEVQLPRVVVEAERERPQALRANPDAVVCADRATLSFGDARPGTLMN